MQNYKMIIAYDGRKYKGFSKPKESPEKSIQGKLELILEKLYNTAVEVISAINTDAGVHAKEQVVNFQAPNARFDEEEILDYFEKYLPDDIIALSVQTEDERFQSRYLMKSATYEYRLWKKDAPYRPLFNRKYVNLVPQIVDVEKMKDAAEDFEGEHDFSAFTSNRKVKNPIKEIISLELEETDCEIIITMTATGYLLNMERIIVGTLIQVGLGQLPINIAEKAFESKNTGDAGHKASADALCLLSVQY